MARTIVDAKGVMRTVVESRKQVLEHLYNKMETELLEYCAPIANTPPKYVFGRVQYVPRRSFTKAYLARVYELSALEVRNFLSLMKKRDVLNPAKPVETNRWHEEAWTIQDRPTPKTVMPRVLPPKGTKKHLPARMRGWHLCKRCGTQIAGSGRHAKSLRGHTQAECDVAMVGQIHSE